MAVSLNGVIAGEDGNEDFLSHDNWIEFTKISNKIGCLIWGRKTYDSVKTWNKSYLESLSKVEKVILSRDPQMQLEKGFYLASTPQLALEMLEKEGYKEVILTGGSTNNSAFAKENLIDEIILDIEPVIVGTGIPLFKPVNFINKLELLSSKSLSNGILQLHYSVVK